VGINLPTNEQEWKEFRVPSSEFRVQGSEFRESDFGTTI
jgi:hypothetical protein